MTHEATIRQIKKDFLKGKKLTTFSVIEKYKHSRLSAVVFDLNKELDNQIKGVWKVSKEGKRFKEFSIQKEK